jgi:hypothetical protein
MYDESKDVQVEGTAVAVSGGAGSVAMVQWLRGGSPAFFQVPHGKTLTITDVVMHPQGDVTAIHTINLAEQTPNGGARIFFQFFVGPGATKQSHFLTEHVIEAGNEVVTFTDANLPFGQHITLWLNGYLPK